MRVERERERRGVDVIAVLTLRQREILAEIGTDAKPAPSGAAAGTLATLRKLGYIERVRISDPYAKQGWVTGYRRTVQP